MSRALQKAVRIPRLELLHWTHESGLGRAQEGDLLLAIPPAGGHLSPCPSGSGGAGEWHSRAGVRHSRISLVCLPKNGQGERKGHLGKVPLWRGLSTEHRGVSASLSCSKKVRLWLWVHKEVPQSLPTMRSRIQAPEHKPAPTLPPRSLQGGKTHFGPWFLSPCPPSEHLGSFY